MSVYVCACVRTCRCVCICLCLCSAPTLARRGAINYYYKLKTIIVKLTVTVTTRGPISFFLLLLFLHLLLPFVVVVVVVVVVDDDVTSVASLVKQGSCGECRHTSLCVVTNLLSPQTHANDKNVLLKSKSERSNTTKYCRPTETTHVCVLMQNA